MDHTPLNEAAWQFIQGKQVLKKYSDTDYRLEGVNAITHILSKSSTTNSPGTSFDPMKGVWHDHKTGKGGTIPAYAAAQGFKPEKPQKKLTPKELYDRHYKDDPDTVEKYFETRCIKLGKDTITKRGYRVNRYNGDVSIAIPVKDNAGNIVRLQRIYIEKDSCRKIRKTLCGSFAGDCAVIVNPGRPRAMVVEGIEDAETFFAHSNWDATYIVTGGTSGFKHIASFLKGYASVDLIADPDKDNLSLKASVHLGDTVERFIPTLGHGVDANAALQAGRFDEWLSSLRPVKFDEVPQKPDAPDTQTVQKEIGFSMQELMKMELPDPSYLIEGILPEGNSLLAGRPKVGKSWLALALAIQVAQSGKGVVYLALEDGKRRLQSRLKKLGIQGNETFFFVTEISRANEGGLTVLKNMVLQKRAEGLDISLIVIDVLQKFRAKSRGGNAGVYELDYEAISPLKDFASDFNVSLLNVHHVRKGAAEDIVDQVSGSTGLTGAMDTILILEKGRGVSGGRLFITGRDIQEQDYAMSFDSETCRWSRLGDSKEVNMSNERKAILTVLKNSNNPLGATTISGIIGGKATPNNVQFLLDCLLSDGYIVKKGRGQYLLTTHNNNDLSTMDAMITQNTMVTMNAMVDEKEANHSECECNHSLPTMVQNLPGMAIEAGLSLNHSNHSDHSGVSEKPVLSLVEVEG
jgi:hypothetical protein